MKKKSKKAIFILGTFLVYGAASLSFSRDGENHVEIPQLNYLRENQITALAGFLEIVNMFFAELHEKNIYLNFGSETDYKIKEYGVIFKEEDYLLTLNLWNKTTSADQMFTDYVNMMSVIDAGIRKIKVFIVNPKLSNISVVKKIAKEIKTRENKLNDLGIMRIEITDKSSLEVTQSYDGDQNKSDYYTLYLNGDSANNDQIIQELDFLTSTVVPLVNH